MKKIYGLLLIVLIGLASQMRLDTYSETGHDQFSKIVFVEKDYKLLKEYDPLYISIRLSDLKKRFWGYSTYIEHEYVDATYVGNVVFSRSNKTRDEYVFDYTLTEVSYYERSINV